MCLSDFLFFFFSFCALKLNTLPCTLVFIFEENQTEISGSNIYFSFMTREFQSPFFFFFPKSCILDKDLLKTCKLWEDFSMGEN